MDFPFLTNPQDEGIQDENRTPIKSKNDATSDKNLTFLKCIIAYYHYYYHTITVLRRILILITLW